jgi:hypothetical protein
MVQVQVTDLASVTPLVVIGAGRAALHVVSRLPTALHEVNLGNLVLVQVNRPHSGNNRSRFRNIHPRSGNNPSFVRNISPRLGNLPPR